MSLLRFQTIWADDFSSFLSGCEYERQHLICLRIWLILSKTTWNCSRERVQNRDHTRSVYRSSFSMSWMYHTVMTDNAIIIRVEIVRARLANGHTRNELSDPRAVRSLTKTTSFQSCHNWIKLCRNLISAMKLKKNLAIRMINGLKFLYPSW